MRPARRVEPAGCRNKARPQRRGRPAARAQAFPGNELLRDLPLELNAVGTVSGHGFHPLKAQLHPVKSLTSTCPAPGAHSSTAANSVLFNHLVGAGEQRWRDVEAKRFGGLE